MNNFQPLGHKMKSFIDDSSWAICKQLYTYSIN
jgi:hypothetical protein